MLAVIEKTPSVSLSLMQAMYKLLGGTSSLQDVSYV